MTSVVAHVKALPHDIIALGADDDDFIVYTKQPGEAFEAPVNEFGSSIVESEANRYGKRKK